MAFPQHNPLKKKKKKGGQREDEIDVKKDTKCPTVRTVDAFVI